MAYSFSLRCISDVIALMGTKGTQYKDISGGPSGIIVLEFYELPFSISDYVRGTLFCNNY